jgi:hypothetical protein
MMSDREQHQNTIGSESKRLAKKRKIQNKFDLIFAQIEVQHTHSFHTKKSKNPRFNIDKMSEDLFMYDVSYSRDIKI